MESSLLDDLDFEDLPFDLELLEFDLEELEELSLDECLNYLWALPSLSVLTCSAPAASIVPLLAGCFHCQSSALHFLPIHSLDGGFGIIIIFILNE